MKTIDEARLETDSAARFRYLAEFIGFTPDDAAAVQSAAPFLGPMIPQIVEQTYAKLLAYDCTARHFVPRQAGYEGRIPENLAELAATHPQVQFRKEHLQRYFMQLLGRTCDERFVPYLDMVGKMHTPAAGNAEIDVPLVQMNALMGFMSDVVFEILSSAPYDVAEQVRIMRAFNKLFWIQNDFITRHYQGRSSQT